MPSVLQFSRQAPQGQNTDLSEHTILRLALDMIPTWRTRFLIKNDLNIYIYIYLYMQNLKNVQTNQPWLQKITQNTLLKRTPPTHYYTI